MNEFLFLCFIGACFPSLFGASKIQMRIVHDTANYGYFANNAAETDVTELVLRSPPANFSGPPLLKKLLGECFNITLERYQYSLCPFQNITQHEVSSRWNSYHGVLGVWSHWRIVDNVFRSMVFRLGDTCGDVDRSVEVVLKCGTEHVLLNVTEPARCQYQALFATKYVCHPDALLVYPRLSPELKKEWDELWTEYKNGHLTNKGYNMKFQVFFRKAGLTKPISEVRMNEHIKNAPAFTDTFADLHTCNKEYDDLKAEIAQLKDTVRALKLLMDKCV